MLLIKFQVSDGMIYNSVSVSRGVVSLQREIVHVGHVCGMAKKDQW